MLREEFGARRVALMGSLDAPWFTEQSDVDLVVEGIEPGAAAAAEERALKLLGAPVDLLLWEELAPSFRRAVETEGRLIA
ncbi:MAG: nucleotidyltransferase family protein [Myxococcota bacterium]